MAHPGQPPATAPAQAPAGTSRAKQWALITLSLAQLMFLLDATIINVALPTIQQAMRLSGPALEWMVTAYSVPFGGLLLLGGRAGDILGKRRVFLGGVLLFTAASLLGGLARASWWLLICRAAQGTGAAAAYPATLALVTVTFPDGPQRHRALGTLQVIGGAGGAIGLIAGGVITTYLSWRWVMFVNVPIGMFLLAATPRVMPETAVHPGRFDLAGALSITLGVMMAVYALISGASGENGPSHWGSPAVLGCLVGAAVLMIIFVYVERRSRRPLVPLRIFANRSRAGCYVVAILLNTSMFGIFFFMTLFVQRVWGFSPLRTALIYVPLTATLVGSGWAGSRLVTRAGVRPMLITGLTAAAVGMAWLSRIDYTSGYATGLLLPCLLTYSGIGLTTVPLTLTAVSGVAAEDSGLASGLFSAARQVGGATGLAVLGTVTWTTVAAATRQATALRATALQAAPGLAHVQAAAEPVTRQALMAGIERGFTVAAGITLLALLVAAAANPRRQTPARSG
jgi:EmrB/QacA subfamily drug resistance transporter